MADLHALTAFAMTQYLDGRPAGTRIAAARVNDQGELQLHLYERRTLNDNTRYWQQIGGIAFASKSQFIVREYDEVIVVWAPDEETANA